jgi:CheY-like chemotaxis protein
MRFWHGFCFLTGTMVNQFPKNPILIVDDEQQYLASVGIALRIAGFDNILLCSDSRTVKDLLMQQSFSLALLDMNMPHRSGIEILDDIRAVQPDLPVIVVTASTRLDNAALGAVKGVFEYLIKPVDRNILLASIRRALHCNKAGSEENLVKGKPLSSQFDHTDFLSSQEHWTNGLWLLEAAREEYRALFNKLPVPFFIMSSETRRIRYANQAFCAFFGVSDFDIPFFTLMDESDRAELERDLKASRPVSGRALAGRTPAGERFTIVATLQLLALEGYIYGSFIGISPKQALGEELSLSERMEALERMAGSIAHDFYNVLHVINGYANLLNDDPVLTLENRRCVHEIMAAVKNGSDIASQLLSIA